MRANSARESMLWQSRILMAALALVSACAAPNADATVIGSSVAAATSQLGIRPVTWQPSSVPGYEVACAGDQTVELCGQRGMVCLIRQHDTVAALAFRVDPCDARRFDAFRSAVISTFGLSDVVERDVYVVRRSGVVHLYPTSDGGANLVVTDAAYGDVYVKQQFREGLSDLVNGLRPH